MSITFLVVFCSKVSFSSAVLFIATDLSLFIFFQQNLLRFLTLLETLYQPNYNSFHLHLWLNRFIYLDIVVAFYLH